MEAHAPYNEASSVPNGDQTLETLSAPDARATPRTRTAIGHFVRRSILPGWAGSIFAGRVSQDGPDDLSDVTALSVKCFRWTA